MKRYVHFPKVEGQASRQAHADLPAGTYEREISKEGFFGPAAHLYHRHPPTGWVNFEGPLRPHAFDCTRLAAQRRVALGRARAAAQRRGARALLALRGEHARAGAQRRRRRAAVRARRAAASCSATTATCRFEAGDYILIPRGTMWRVECAEPLRALLIEATNNSYRLPDKGLVGPHAIFDAAMLDTPRIDDAFRDQQDDSRVARRDQAAQRDLHRHLSIQPARRGGLARRPVGGAHQRARPAAADEPSLSPAALGAHHLRRGSLRGLQLRAAAVRDRIRAR